MNPFILTAMDYPEVTSRELYAKSNDECLYIITFKDTPYTGMFRIDLIAPTTWHYDKELPNRSYFQKRIGAKLERFLISECIVYAADRDIVFVASDKYVKGVLIGLARLPNDIECFEYLCRQLSPNDETLLERKKENQSEAAKQQDEPQ
jgi:hypothetical protein